MLKIINTRRLVEIDVAYHGRKLILVEFTLTIVVALGLSALFLWKLIAAPHMLAAVYLFVSVGIGANYAQLLSHVLGVKHRIHLVNVTSIERREAFRYTRQSILLLIPFLILCIGMRQSREP